MEKGLYQQFFKRPFDILASTISLILFSWLFLCIALAYVFTRQRPVTFVQVRIGRDNKSFRLLKFRTLASDTTLSLQQRRFPLGDLLRKYSLDELPQFVNVLKGEMSLVGPRPLPVAYLPLFSAEQARRHHVRPGITGWAQVNGRNSISWEEKFKLDNYYATHVSFSFDCKILLRTLILFFSFHPDSSLTEESFKGNL